jgi:hypothetical protein
MEKLKWKKIKNNTWSAKQSREKWNVEIEKKEKKKNRTCQERHKKKKKKKK